MKKITDSTVKSYPCIEITGRWFQIVTNMERSVSYLQIKDIPDKKRCVYKHATTVLTQVGVKQLTDFLRTVTSASDLVDCSLVNCVNRTGQFEQPWSHTCSKEFRYVRAHFRARQLLPQQLILCYSKMFIELVIQYNNFITLYQSR